MKSKRRDPYLEPYIERPARLQRPLHPLAVVLAFGLILGVFSLLLVTQRLPDSLLILFAIPVVISPLFFYDRKVYLPMVALLAVDAIWVTSILSGNFQASLLTIVFSVASSVIMAEIVFRLFNLRQRAEGQLRESESRFRQLAENIHEVFWLRTADRFLYVSPAYEEMWGRSREELYADPGAHFEALHPEDRERILEAYSPQRTLSDEVFREQFRIVHPDGNVRWIRTRSFPVRDKAGRIDGRAGIDEDVTEQVHTEEELKRHNRELALLNRASQAFASTLDLDRVLAIVLEETRHLLGVAACSIWLLDAETGELVCLLATGMQRELVRGWRLAPGEGLAGWVARSGESLIVPDAEADERYFRQVDRLTGLRLRSILTVPLQTNRAIVGVIQALDEKIGRFRPADQALLEPLAAAAAIAIDNARLYQETDRLRAFNENIVHSMDEGIFLEDATGHIAFANPRIADLLGYTCKELVGRHWRETVPPEHVAQIESETARRPRGIPGRYEAVLLGREGTRIPVIVSAMPLFENGQFSGVLSVFTDITERVRAEQELRASEEQYRDLVENVSDVIYAVDRDGIVTYASPFVESLLGYPPAEIVGRAFATFVHPEDLGVITENYEKVMVGQAQTNEYRLVTRSGETRWVRTSSRPILNGGQVVGLRGVLSDVSERVRAEQERRDLESKLERARRMESLGTLAGGVAHDLNNILGPMVAYPELILDELPRDSPIRQDVLQIQNSAKGAVAIIQDLLALARRGIYRTAPLNLNAVVEDYFASATFAELSARHPQVIVDMELAPSLLNVLGSAPHLSKALMNLVTNAFEAMPYGGRLTVRTTNEHLDRPHAGYEQIEPGDYVVLRIGDTGVGIEKGDLSRIFEPFYTKKEMGRSGSGLGLAVVYGVSRDHKARIDLRTEVGQGTEFALYFPVAREALPEQDRAQEDYRGNERVLVVDDMEEQRKLAVRLLSSLGYQVEAVESGRAAVAYLCDRGADILVLDMIMEEDFDGLDTYREIAQSHPGIKAIIASGFSKTERVQEAQRLGAGPFVRKPYTLQGLGQAVRKELDRPLERESHRAG
jgi:PAS domain S-box-containing protein